MTELIIERYKAPKHKGNIPNPDLSFKDHNLSCGDHIQIDLRIDRNRMITEAAFSGQGCSVSIASADLLLDQIIGQPLERIRALTKDEFLAGLNLNIPIRRENCAVLAYDILIACISEDITK